MVVERLVPGVVEHGLKHFVRFSLAYAPEAVLCVRVSNVIYLGEVYQAVFPWIRDIAQYKRTVPTIDIPLGRFKPQEYAHIIDSVRCGNTDIGQHRQTLMRLMFAGVTDRSLKLFWIEVGAVSALIGQLQYLPATDNLYFD